MTAIPELTTTRLRLRGLRGSDWDDYAALNADPRVRDWLGGTLLSREQAWASMESLLGQWALRGYGVFAVECGGRFAGRVGLLHPAGQIEPELAWTLAPSFWGQGLATEAAARVRDWGLETFGPNRLISYIVPENARSRRVAEKLGAVPATRELRRGLPHDVWVHPRPGCGLGA